MSYLDNVLCSMNRPLCKQTDMYGANQKRRIPLNRDDSQYVHMCMFEVEIKINFPECFTIRLWNTILPPKCLICY
jgi:hypothetical protein